MSKCIECKMNYVQKAKSNGDVMLRKQCSVCGYTDSKNYKFLDVGGIDKVKQLAFFNDDLLNEFYEKQRESKLREYEQKREYALNEYSEYLKSDKWKAKRLRVLKRDNYQCKACESNTATQVHHLSYEFIYNEPLFDLVSVCKTCHDKIEYLKLKKKGLI